MWVVPGYCMLGWQMCCVCIKGFFFSEKGFFGGILLYIHRRLGIYALHFLTVFYYIFLADTHRTYTIPILLCSKHTRFQIADHLPPKVELNPLSPNIPTSPTLYLRGSTPARLDPSTPMGGELALPSPFPHIISHGFGTPTGEFLGVVLANHGGIWVLNKEGLELGWTGGAEAWWEAIPHVGREEEDNAKGRMVDVSVSGNGEVAVVVEWGGGWKRRGVQGK